MVSISSGSTCSSLVGDTFVSGLITTSVPVSSFTLAGPPEGSLLVRDDVLLLAVVIADVEALELLLVDNDVLVLLEASELNVAS